jgi:hypothetical protein
VQSDGKCKTHKLTMCRRINASVRVLLRRFWILVEDAAFWKKQHALSASSAKTSSNCCSVSASLARSLSSLLFMRPTFFDSMWFFLDRLCPLSPISPGESARNGT